MAPTTFSLFISFVLLVLAVICTAASPTPNSGTTKPAGTSTHPTPPAGAKTSSDEELLVYIQKLRDLKKSPSERHRNIPKFDDDTKYSTTDDVKSSKHTHSSAKPAKTETEPSLSSSSSSPKSTKMSPESSVAQKKSSDSSSTDTTIHVTALNMELDAKIVLIVGLTASGLLIVLTVIIVFIVCRKGGLCSRKGKKDFSLNKDLHTWDPQILRPDQKNIDAFIFGKPIPTVDEMIKQ